MKAPIIALALLAMTGCATATLDVGKLIGEADIAVTGAAAAAKVAAPSLSVATRQEAENDLDNLNALMRDAHAAYALGKTAQASADLANVNAGLAALKTLIGGH